MTSRNASSVRRHGQGARGGECRGRGGGTTTTPAEREREREKAASRRIVASAVLPMTLVKVETELR